MWCPAYIKRLALISILLLANPAWVVADSGISLTLQQAEALAIQRDDKLSEFRLLSESLQEKTIAEDTLPDPKLKLGLLNFPTDTFDRDQEAMTQIQVGVVQRFPRGKTLELKSGRVEDNAKGELARAEVQRRNVIQQVRINWLDVYYWQNAAEVVSNNRKLFNQLVNVTQSLYAVGRRKQEDVLQAELELGLLDDRQTQVETMIETSRAKLAKLIGSDAAERPLFKDFPVLPEVVGQDQKEERLNQHPLLLLEQAKINASQKNVEIARQAYKPEWALDVTYGFRDGYNPDGTERSNMLTAMVLMDMPIFTGNRQDKNLSASKLQHQAAMHSRDDQLRELNKLWHVNHAEWTRLGERLRLYETSLIKKAHVNANAALHAYQNDRGDFSSVMRARMMEFETQLKALNVRVEYAKSQTKLLYLQGDKE
jgi:outer membrane protein TolC